MPFHEHRGNFQATRQVIASIKRLPFACLKNVVIMWSSPEEEAFGALAQRNVTCASVLRRANMQKSGRATTMYFTASFCREVANAQWSWGEEDGSSRSQRLMR
jgi:hypothetical protein